MVEECSCEALEWSRLLELVASGEFVRVPLGDDALWLTAGADASVRSGARGRAVGLAV